MINENSLPTKKSIAPAWPTLKRLLLIVGGIMMIASLNFRAVQFFADDLFFIHNADPLVLTLAEHYKTWSSHLLIETLLLFLARHLLLWRILNCLVMLSFAYLMAVYTTSRRKAFHTYLAILFFFSIPLKSLQTTGWLTSSLNYLWPMAAVLIGLFPVIYWYQKRRRCKPTTQMLCNYCLLFACNSEFTAVFISLLLLGLISYSYIKDGKFPKLLIFPTIISYGSILFARHRPENAANKIVEAKINLKDFQHVTLLHKLDLGFSSTCHEFFFNTNLLTIFFFALLLLAVFRNQSSHFTRFSALMPTIVLLGSVIRHLLTRWQSQSMVERTLKSANTHLFPFDEIFFALLFLLTLWALLHSLKSLRKGLLLSFLFLISFSSRVLVGFTPAIWTADFRTFLLFYVGILWITLTIYQEISSLPYTKYLVLLFNLAGILTFVSIL